MISVLIPTKNEATDLPGCLDSLGWCDDIHVFDSFSTDATESIARARGACFHQRAFDGYASQKNAALRQVRFRHPWVLLLDADERIPLPLVTEMKAWVAAASPGVVAVRLRRRDFLFNTWLRRAQISPYYLRLVRPTHVHFEREVNEVLVPEGKVADLTEPFDHFPFSKGISHWIEKHNRYATMEAAQALAERRGGSRFSLRLALFGADFHTRRFHQKGLFYRLPCRPFIKYCYMMFGRGAVLDGSAGWTYCALQAWYEFLIVIKERELKLKKGEPPS